MARKTTKNTAAKTAKPKTARQVARKAQRDAVATKDPGTSAAPPATVDQTALPLGDHALDTHVLASTLQQNLTPSLQPAPVQQAVRERQDAIARAVQDREAAARRAAGRVAQVEADAAAQRVALASTDVKEVLRAPLDNPTQRRVAPAGIHPDVTSSTSHALDMPVPGTGVAELTDLAPGQDLSPSPPVSSSNILPQPDKPGSLYSKL